MKLFSKRKNKNSEIENREVRDNKEAEPRTTIIHSQRICKGLLYSTEDSELVVCWKHSDSCEEDKAALFKTKNGRWFRCLQKTKEYVYFNLDICKYIVEEKRSVIQILFQSTKIMQKERSAIMTFRSIWNCGETRWKKHD